MHDQRCTSVQKENKKKKTSSVREREIRHKRKKKKGWSEISIT